MAHCAQALPPPRADSSNRPAPRLEYRHPRWGKCCAMQAAIRRKRRRICFLHGVGFLCGSVSILAPARWRGKTGPADVSAAIHSIDLSDIVFRKDGQYPSRVNHPAHQKPTCPSYGRPGSLPAQPAGRIPVPALWIAPAPFRRSPAEQNLSRPLRQESFFLACWKSSGMWETPSEHPVPCSWGQGGRASLLQRGWAFLSR